MASAAVRSSGSSSFVVGLLFILAPIFLGFFFWGGGVGVGGGGSLFCCAVKSFLVAGKERTYCFTVIAF